MPPLKDQISADLGRQLARELHTAWAPFPKHRFSRGLAAALEPLELMDRLHLLAARLKACLPPAFDDGSAVIREALQSPTFDGWMTVPCGFFVTEAGIGDPRRALPLLAGLTPRWSSEFAIRPFIEAHPEVTYEHLHEWTSHPDEHIRRLVSEGTRPRLPWAPILHRLTADPTPNIGLLERLVADASPYVRRSVANHLNDISKDHPDLAVALGRKWMQSGEAASRTVAHGLRSLIKQGHPDALHAIGIDPTRAIHISDLRVDPRHVEVGGAVTLSFTLELDNAETTPADAVIDYRVHYAGPRTVRAPKVFKLARRNLQSGEPSVFVRQHRFEPRTVRNIHPGTHTIDIQVNGLVLGSVAVEVTGGAGDDAILVTSIRPTGARRQSSLENA
jgi:3-methyladenine DNA glycosylase AlkC